MKFIKTFNEAYSLDFKRWKRKNVTLRGIREIGEEENGGSAILGKGLYTTPLSNRAMAKTYGTVRFVVNAIPKNPMIFQSLNAWEIYLSKLITETIGEYDVRKFYKNHTIEDVLMSKGYDGVIIKGREMVNFKPKDVRYYSNETQLYNAYIDFYSPDNSNI